MSSIKFLCSRSFESGLVFESVKYVYLIGYILGVERGVFMVEDNWDVLDEVSGSIDAEIIRGFLESQGISVILSQEGAGRAIGLTVGPLGETQILVPKSQLSEAKEILEDYYRSRYNNQIDDVSDE